MNGSYATQRPYLTRTEKQPSAARRLGVGSRAFLLFRIGPLIALLLSAVPAVRVSAQDHRVANVTLNVPLNPPAGTYTLENAFGEMALGPGWRGLPVAITAPLGETNRLFIASQFTGISVISDLANPTTAMFLDIRERVLSGGESGLLGLAFHPGFATNRYFYVYYSAVVPSGSDIVSDNRLSRFTASLANPDEALPDSEQVLFSQPFSAGNHYGGDLHFGPDGYLYVSLGDGVYRTNSQRIDGNFFGGILRIDVDKRAGNLEPNPFPTIPRDLQGMAYYSVPSDNPFIGAMNFNGESVDMAAVRTEFWAVGLRNPWRMSFDSLTGDFYCGDVGSGTAEEINRLVRGGNYGWPFLEGTNVLETPPSDFQSIMPIRSIPWGNGDDQARSVIGGVVYRGSQIPELYGSYVFANFTGGQVWKMNPNATNDGPLELLTAGVQLSAFGIDPRNGDILAAAYQESVIKRLVRGAGTNETSLPATLSATGAFSDLATLTPEAGVVPYEINVPFWSDHAIKSRWFSIPDTNQMMTFSAAGNWSFPTGTVWIKHFEMELTNGVAASRRRLETRFLVKNASGAHGFTYRWNTAQTDADLVASGGVDEAITVYQPDGSLLRNQTWHYPSRSECFQCHTAPGGYALGFNTGQLNRTHDYGTGLTNQIATLSRVGYFDGPTPAPDTLAHLAPADDTSVSLEYRARSYFQANCVQCHQPGGAAQGQWDARIATPMAAAGILNGPLVNNYGNEANRVIRPGSLAQSVLFQRILQFGAGHMPPLATTELNQEAIGLLGQWITNILSSVSVAYDGNGQIHLTYAGEPGRAYRIEASNELVQWQTRATVVATALGVVDFSDEIGSENSSQFYRIAWP